MLVDRATTTLVLEQHRRAIGCGVLVAPLQQRDDHGPEIEALLGQAVLEALRPFLVAVLLQHTGLEQTGKA